MAEGHQRQSNDYEPTVSDEGALETKDRGLFDFMGKIEEGKPQEEVTATESEKVQVSEPQPKVGEPMVEEEKKPGLFEKLHRSGSSSSKSSSDEEGEEEDEGEEGEEKKEEKGLKEKISVAKEEEKHEDTTVPVEQIDEVPRQEQASSEKKKGFLDKMKEKVIGQHKKADEVPPPPPPPPAETATVEEPSHEGEAGQDQANREEKKSFLDKIKEKLSIQHRKVHEVPPPTAETATVEGEAKEKKGLWEKIKEKLPGYHPKTEEEKESEKISLRGDLLPLYHPKNEKKKERGRISLKGFLHRVYHPKTEEEKEREENLIRRRKLCV